MVDGDELKVLSLGASTLIKNRRSKLKKNNLPTTDFNTIINSSRIDNIIIDQDNDVVR